MQLSKFTDYAFRALMYLGRNNKENLTIDRLSENLDIPVHHLKKIINKLAKTEYLTSIKGRNGGLKLGLTPDKINLGEVLKLTEVNLNLVECMNNTSTCPLICDCKLKGAISNSLEAFVEEMSKYTLEDIL
jgi:Rrf2 family transcriptional regulator, nitric oxide-sensitive transcriptional repressor